MVNQTHWNGRPYRGIGSTFSSIVLCASLQIIYFYVDNMCILILVNSQKQIYWWLWFKSASCHNHRICCSVLFGQYITIYIINFYKKPTYFITNKILWSYSENIHHIPIIHPKYGWVYSNVSHGFSSISCCRETVLILCPVCDTSSSNMHSFCFDKHAFITLMLHNVLCATIATKFTLSSNTVFLPSYPIIASSNFSSLSVETFQRVTMPIKTKHAHSIYTNDTFGLAKGYDVNARNGNASAITNLIRWCAFQFIP